MSRIVAKRLLGGCAGLLLGFASVTQAGELGGSIGWDQRVEMGLLVNGVVASVKVKPGQRVAQGELLLNLDQRGFRAALAAADAELKRAEALLAEAEREQQRAEELYERTVLSEHERVLANIALAEAQADAGRARAQQVQASLDLEHSQLRTPVNGVVLAVHASPGEAIVNALSSQPVLELAADDRMRLILEADLATAKELQNKPLQIELAGQMLPVKSLQIGLEPLSGTVADLRYRVDAYFERPKNLHLRVGEKARLVW